MRRSLAALEQIPNIGPSLAMDLKRVGVEHPQELVGKNPYALYEALCASSGVRQDPCVLDAFIAAVRFMEGAPAQPWWRYSAERKRHFGG